MRGPTLPTMSGGPPDREGGGRSSQSRAWKKRPSKSIRPSRSNVRMIVNASSNREMRWSNGKPNDLNSVSFQPAPRPRISRPLLTSSTVAASLASIAGAWNAVDATSGPSRMREVLAASAESIVQASHGPRAEPSA